MILFFPTPRKPRIHYPGAVDHVMLRGNGGQDIFFDPADRTRFLLALQQGLEETEAIQQRPLQPFPMAASVKSGPSPGASLK
jgi:hypothetical protein